MFCTYAFLIYRLFNIDHNYLIRWYDLLVEPSSAWALSDMIEISLWMTPLLSTFWSTIFQRTGLRTKFQVGFTFHTYPSMKEALRNWRKKLNTRGVLLGITRDCSSQFQLQSKILQNITMSTIFSTLAHLIQLWPIKLYVVSMERKLMIIMFSFLQVSQLSSDAELFKFIYQTLIPEKKIRPTTITTPIYWEWTSCESTPEAILHTIFQRSK